MQQTKKSIHFKYDKDILYTLLTKPNLRLSNACVTVVSSNKKPESDLKDVTIIVNGAAQQTWLQVISSFRQYQRANYYHLQSRKMSIINYLQKKYKKNRLVGKLILYLGLKTRVVVHIFVCSQGVYLAIDLCFVGTVAKICAKP